MVNTNTHLGILEALLGPLARLFLKNRDKWRLREIRGDRVFEEFRYIMTLPNRNINVTVKYALKNLGGNVVHG